MTTDFTHLHCHSEHSILDGYSSVSEMPHIVAEMGQTSMGLTDHGSLGGALKLWKAAKEAEIKHIFGVEAYVTPDLKDKDKDSPTWHLVLLAQNRKGLENLFSLSRIGWNQGFYKKPRIDHATLAKHSEGLICLSACMAGEVARALETPIEDGQPEFDKYQRVTDGAVEAALNHKAIFGDRYYAELQPGNPKILNTLITEVAHQAGVKTVVTVDSHYDTCENKSVEELLLVMQQVSGFKKSDRDFAYLMKEEATREPSLIHRLNKLWPNRGLRYDKLELHLMSRDEVVSKMDLQGFDGDALADTTLEIAERCEPVDFKTGQVYLPALFPKEDPDAKLRELAYAGLEWRGLEDDPRYVERLEEELQVFKDKGFSNYMLIVWDIISEARRRNIYVGPGRGSAAGCLVAYCLRITNIDPIKYKLLFFRFINAERNDFPDIDMDFEHHRRDEMKTYMEEKWGERLSLCTYAEFKAKGLFASVCKSLGFKEAEIRAVTKHFNTLDEYEEAEGTKSFRAKNPEVLQYCRALEGHVSGTGMHAAGVVVADRPMHEIVPIESRTDPENKKLRVAVSGFNMGDSEEMGLIKMDFLGLVNLSQIHDCVDMIKERHGVTIDWENLEPDDPDVLDMLNGANTVGVFQMESNQYRNLLKQQGVHDFNDMVASNALVRPGAFETVAKDYIRRKHGKEAVTYPHEDTVEWLEDTFGTYIYQEQVMALSVVLGGFSWSEADRLRKIIGKKKDASEFAPFFEKWIANAGEKIGVEDATKMWHDFEKHSGYSFNKSHSVGYSYVSYVTAYLKYHYPLEYIYSMLKHDKNTSHFMTYLLEARRLGIEIVPPDVNTSIEEMTVTEDGKLLFGLSDIKNCGITAAKHLMSLRPFASWQDFSDRIEARKCNSRVVESLVAVDALRSISDAPRNSEADRNYMEYLNYPLSLEYVYELGINYQPIEEYDEDERDNFMVVCGVVKSIKRTDRYVRIELEDMSGSMTCFGSMTNDLDTGELVIALVGEKTMVGYARVDGLRERIANGNLHSFEKLIIGKLFDDYQELFDFGIGGIGSSKSMVVPLSVRRVTTKTGKKMAFSYITDGTEIIKLTIFPREWAQIEKLFEEYVPVCVKLRWLDDGGRTVNADGVIQASELLRLRKEKLNARK